VLLTSLSLHSFRNYEAWEMSPAPGLTVLVGPNASGKTNIIEAVQLITTGLSFRKPHWEDLVRWGDEGASISAGFEGESSRTTVEMRITSSGQRTHLINNVNKRRATETTGVLPSILFTPDDLDLVKGPGEMRRSAIDDLGEQLSKTYGAVRRNYSKVIRHRNTLLREWQASTMDLEPWDIQVASLGARLLVHRRRLLERMVVQAAEIYAGLSGGEMLSIEYHDRCGLSEHTLGVEIGTDDAERSIIRSLGERADEEKTRRVTLVGPHRDDIVFLVDDRNARTFASQGQQRTIALAWTLAKVSVVEDITHQKPMMLLDDVMSELDTDRRRALTGLVQRGVQTIISTTNTGYFDEALLKQAAVITIPGT
jgi:DNA replication and repair protein RecF